MMIIKVIGDDVHDDIEYGDGGDYDDEDEVEYGDGGDDDDDES